jgi:hypothetical protein
MPTKYDRLEPSLQEKFEEFMKERGVGDELALFIPAFAEYKEQKVITTGKFHACDVLTRLLGIRWVATAHERLC